MKNVESKTGRAWIEINIENLRHNAETLKKAMQPGCELMAVVKAQAYGHGAILTASHLNKLGVRAFAVATLDEGIALRKGGICGEILILGHTEVERASELKEYDLMQALISFAYAEALNHQGIAVKGHIKIDTGMHRLGIACGELSSVRKVFFMENIKVCGMFTHLCCSDSRHPDDVSFTKGQIASFYRMADALRDSGITLPKLHIQSSYGLLNYPHLACDYVRAGIALYGVLSSPDDDTVLKLELRPVLSLRSRVVLIREVAAGESVGYGRDFTAGRDTRIAILPIGYGDGFPRNLSGGKGSILIKQYVVPIVGRICMDQLAVDITDAEDVTVGDLATLAGASGYDQLSVPVIADNSGSISNELLCRMGARLPVITR
ncbi:MAG: serine racemase VanT catalytic subunit [Lachnospiraceae bacterium]|nr:serine racemase VanT catalytic subunit [Lachnospiraceae bacterium]